MKIHQDRIMRKLRSSLRFRSTRPGQVAESGCEAIVIQDDLSENYSLDGTENVIEEKEGEMNTDKIRKAIEITQLAAAATMTVMQLVVVIREGGGEKTHEIGFRNRNSCQKTDDPRV